MLVDDNMNNLKALSFIFEMLKERFIINILKEEDGSTAVKLFTQKNSKES